MSYIAYLCYPQQCWGDDLEEQETIICFEEPENWKYERVIPIQFSPLHRWSDKDKGLYK